MKNRKTRKGSIKRPGAKAGTSDDHKSLLFSGKPLSNRDEIHSLKMTIKKNGTGIKRSKRLKNKEEREGIVLWKKPLKTLHYSTAELISLFLDYGKKLLSQRTLLFSILCLLATTIILLITDNPAKQVLFFYEKYIMWCLMWIGLGILSSVGLGTGLHTFVLYLGPHIAAVTMAAYECGSLNFPEPPYPDDIICPEGSSKESLVSIWEIMSKVRVECILWGAGTALGELPPYFVARTHRLSGFEDEESEEDDEFTILEKKKKENPNNLNIFDKTKIAMEKFVEKVGFFGILACASIPNPLFDLAGITCGHFLVPFTTFFGATLIGKAIFKMHIQKLFIILAFNDQLIQMAVSQIRLIPIFGKTLEIPFTAFLTQQKERLHRGGENEAKSSSSEIGSSNIFSMIFEKIVLVMILYFVVSIINSLAQNYHKRNVCKDKKN